MILRTGVCVLYLTSYKHFWSQVLKHHPYFTKEKSKELGAEILFVDFIEEHTELKNWYIKNDFVHKGTEKYEHLPFTVGKAEYVR